MQVVQPQNDDLVMGLVELALGRFPEEREAYLQGVCADNSELFAQVWKYVQWEEGMSGFLLDPLCDPPSHEHAFEPGEVLDGRFRIVREVARGGMGVVYEAIDQKLERRIAIKENQISCLPVALLLFLPFRVLKFILRAGNTDNTARA